MKRAQGFVIGFGTALGAVALLNARVLGFAAAYNRLPAELRDGAAAARSIEQALAEELEKLRA